MVQLELARLLQKIDIISSAAQHSTSERQLISEVSQSENK